MAALCAAAAAGAARAPSKAELAGRYSRITNEVNAAGSTFLEEASALVAERRSGREIYRRAALPFIRALRAADARLLAMGARRRARSDVVALVRLDRRTIADLARVSTSSRARVARWQQSISNDANAMVVAAGRLRTALG